MTTGGVEARVRFEPFMMSPPKNYRAPDPRPSPSTWDLDAGFWVLTVEPVKKGIVDVVVKPTGLVDAALGLVGLGSEVAARPVKASVRFPSVRLDTLHSYAGYLNRQPGVAAGFVVRPLPVDLDEPLPLTQRPGEELRVPFETAGGLLRAEAEDGSLLDVRVDGGDWQQGLAVTAGTHTAEVRVTGTATVVYSLAVTPHALLATTPLPPVPDALLAGLPDYPVLADGEPQFLDLERDETRTFLLRAAEPALYRLESTGLLETAGTVRTRVVPALNTQSANGVGRNFFVEQYLREGDYQLSVSAQGRSQGHLGRGHGEGAARRRRRPHRGRPGAGVAARRDRRRLPLPRRRARSSSACAPSAPTGVLLPPRGRRRLAAPPPWCPGRRPRLRSRRLPARRAPRARRRALPDAARARAAAAPRLRSRPPPAPPRPRGREHLDGAGRGRAPRARQLRVRAAPRPPT